MQIRRQSTLQFYKMEKKKYAPQHRYVCYSCIVAAKELRVPVILRGCDIGQCREKWSPEYLSTHCPDEHVKVHVSENVAMDFVTKNFLYRTLPFKELIKRCTEVSHDDYFISPTEVYYLRALGSNPRSDVADFHQNFPQLTEDIKFPELFEPQQYFSSVFRMASAGVQLWTHYDIMDNLLMQIKGRKQAVLFSPTDAENLYMTGDKSEVLNIDSPDLEKFPLFDKVTKYEGLLEEGDVLFIPALWFHNMKALEFSVAVNVFWRHLPRELYDKNDVYGNKDLTAGSRALQVVDRALKILQELPEDYRDFYARRIILKTRKNACKEA